jgi:exportin-1
MISAQPNKRTQETLIERLMELPNSAVSYCVLNVRARADHQWDNLMSQAASNVDVLANPENVKIMSNILKTNVSACTSIGSFFLPQLGRIWLDMLGLYKAVSGIISEQVATQGKLLESSDRTS